MEWLNFHHFRYFWTVARKGRVRKAARRSYTSLSFRSARNSVFSKKRSARSYFGVVNGISSPMRWAKLFSAMRTRFSRPVASS